MLTKPKHCLALIAWPSSLPMPTFTKSSASTLLISFSHVFPSMTTWLNFRVGGFTSPLCLRQYVKCISFTPSLPPSPLILAGDKSIAIYDSFVAVGRPLLPCLAVIPVDSFRSVSLFKSCCNYTGFSICRRPDMIQAAATGRGGAQTGEWEER